MENFQVHFTSDCCSSVSKIHVGKEKNVDVSSRLAAAPPPGDRIIDGSVTGCRIQGRWGRFRGTRTHIPEWQEDGTTTNFNFNSSTADGYNLEVPFTGGLALRILVNASTAQDDGPVPHQTLKVNLCILSVRSLDSGINLNTNDATLSKNIHCQRTKQLTLDNFLLVRDRDKLPLRRQRTANTAGDQDRFQG